MILNLIMALLNLINFILVDEWYLKLVFGITVILNVIAGLRAGAKPMDNDFKQIAMRYLLKQLFNELDDAVSFMELFAEDEAQRERRLKKEVLLTLTASFMQDFMQEKDGK